LICNEKREGEKITPYDHARAAYRQTPSGMHDTVWARRQEIQNKLSSKLNLSSS